MCGVKMEGLGGTFPPLRAHFCSPTIYPIHYIIHSLTWKIILPVNDNTVDDINPINASHPCISKLYFMHQHKLANTANRVYHNNASFPVKQNHISDLYTDSR